MKVNESRPRRLSVKPRMAGKPPNSFWPGIDIQSGLVVGCTVHTVNWTLLLMCKASCPQLGTHLPIFSGNEQEDHSRELTENIPNWAYYPQMRITNSQLGIIYPIGDWGYMSLVMQSQRTNQQPPIG